MWPKTIQYIPAEIWSVTRTTADYSDVLRELSNFVLRMMDWYILHMYFYSLIVSKY